jgi:tRNA nucleotidyltransferase (CCA-adding enzyme)
MRNDIEKKILQKIKPTVEENQHIQQITNDIKKQILTQGKKVPYFLDVMLVGSIAKETYLSGNLDIDLFILFNPQIPYEHLEKFGLQIGKKVLPQWTIQYADHPYVRGIYRGFQVDIVPCCKVDHPSNKISAVDRTPFHTNYVIQHLKEDEKDDVRLLKKFLQGIECYGAEEKIRGFSGYLAELLIIYHHSFANLVLSCQNWNYGEFFHLDTEPYTTFRDPLIFIDPVDPTRNVASALSKEKFQIFISACKAYQSHPKKEFFLPNPVTPLPLTKIKKKVKNCVGIRIPKPFLVEDVLYSQIRKACKNLVFLCNQYDFFVEDFSYHVNDNITIFLQLKNMVLPSNKLHMGPPCDKMEHVSFFKKRWQDSKYSLSQAFERDGRWWIEIKRQFTDVWSMLQEKIKDINLGKHLTPLVNKIEILKQEQLITDRYAVFWTKYLDKKMPWER